MSTRSFSTEQVSEDVQAGVVGLHHASLHEVIRP